MSHQTKQTNKFVTINDLNLLERAVRSISIESLGTHLVLNKDKKEARYYGMSIDRDCFAVIEYARPLTDQEKYQNYEIGVKKAPAVAGAPQSYDLFADTHASDRSMQYKIASVLEEYQIAVATETMMSLGATNHEEITEDVPDGYRVFEYTVPD